MSELTFIRYDITGRVAQGNFTSGVQQFSMTKLEGSAEASWIFDLDSDSSGIRSWFGRYFMNRISVRYGGHEVWSGWIWEMEAEGRGGSRLATMDDVYNRVMVSYTSENDAGEPTLKQYAPQLTDDFGEDYPYPTWMSNPTSIARYGLMEHIEDISSSSPDEAYAYAEQLLRRHATPYIQPRTSVRSSGNILRVTCVGAMALANRVLLPDKEMLLYWRDPDGPIGSRDDSIGRLRYSPKYPGAEWGASTYNGEPWTVSLEIDRIIDAVNHAWGDVPVLYARQIDDNDSPTALGCSSVTPAFDRLRQLAQIPGPNGGGYVLQVATDGGVSYRSLASLPVMYYDYLNGRGVERVDGSVPSWQSEPGLVQEIGDPGYRELPPVAPDQNSPDIEIEPAAFLPTNQRYFERVEMSEGDEYATLAPRHITPADYRRAIETNRRWLKQEK